MNDMSYEFLIRAVFKTGRTKKNGADADIYRNMQYAYNDLTTKVMFQTQDDREYEYRKTFAAVRSHVESALKEGIKLIRYAAPAEEVQQLEKMTASLNWDFYDKDELDNIISQALSAFKKHGLEA